MGAAVSGCRVLDALGAEESADLAPGVCVRVVCGMRVFVKMGAAVSSCRVCWMRWGLESQQVWLQVCVCVCVCVLFLACVCV